jgi:prepilin-type N-terminal cleavage/methylation domain-containing protein
MKTSQRAFTLIEILVVTAIFAVIIALGLLMSMETFRGTTFRSERDTMIGVLTKARSRSMANIKQSPWGVHYAGSPNFTYTIFKGSTYVAGAATNEDLPGNKDSTVTGWPVGDIVFSQLSGTTTAVVTPPIAIAENSRTANVTVNYEGTITW